jgi:hypothetical protein
MPMQLIETKVLASAIHMRFADHVDPEQAKQWIDFQVPLDELIDPYAQGVKLKGIAARRLGVIQVAALRHMRGIIDEENQRLLDLAAHML